MNLSVEINSPSYYLSVLSPEDGRSPVLSVWHLPSTLSLGAEFCCGNWLCCRNIHRDLTECILIYEANITSSWYPVMFQSYLVSRVLRKRPWTTVLSSCVGATFSSDAVLSSTRRDLLAGGEWASRSACKDYALHKSCDCFIGSHLRLPARVVLPRVLQASVDLQTLPWKAKRSRNTEY